MQQAAAVYRSAATSVGVPAWRNIFSSSAVGSPRLALLRRRLISSYAYCTSELLRDNFDDVCRTFQRVASTDRTDDTAVKEFIEFLVSQDLLTEWQCEKLREGRYKGFYIDQIVRYKFLSFVRVEADHTVYLAEDLLTKHQVHVLCKPPSYSGGGEGSFRFVEIDEDESSTATN